MTVGGGTPRLVHSRPNDAMASGCARKKLAPSTPRDQLVEIVGGRRAGAGGKDHRRRDIGDQAISRIVDQLALMCLLDLLDQDAELLLDLVEGPAVEIRHAGLHVEHGGDRAQEILAGMLLVIDEGLRQIGIGVAGRAQLDIVGRYRGRAARLFHTV